MTTTRRGYLNEPYRLFHSSDQRDLDFEAHSHDFHKLVFCLSGKVSYVMEGLTYSLGTGDLLRIPQHQIHQSRLYSNAVYERYILWINDSFLCSFHEPALTDLFVQADPSGRELYHPTAAQRREMIDKLRQVELFFQADQPGHQLMADTYLLQFLLELSAQLRHSSPAPDKAVAADPRFSSILSYINQHLQEDLSIERLSGMFYLSPSYLMHTFRKRTGCTVHQYIQQKRLMYAADLIRQGEGITQAAQCSGFSDYTAFLRAFRKMYGCAPSEIR